MIRKLNHSDYENYIDLLSQLTSVGDVTKNQFDSFINIEGQQTYVYEVDNKLAASLTILMEQKIAHSFSKSMHIEDVITNINHRGKGYASILINFVIDIAKKENCYKIILNCNNKNIAFYNKFGFLQKETQMALYL
jgi:glucosamine-phosphate N-acetyltransferase